MNCNFYWQPASISLIPTNPTCLYFDQSHIKTSNHIDFEFGLKQIKRKCKELELENSQLKEEISILEKMKQRKGKRIVKRRKEEQLDKKFKCSHFNCKKEYASALALNLHMRTKHPHDEVLKDSQKKSEISDEQNSVKQQGEYSNTKQ